MAFVFRRQLRNMCSLVQQRFSKDIEKAINNQINMELCASYGYLSMSYHFDRSDVALNGVRDFFEHSSVEERDHAKLFMKYLNQRGGTIMLSEIKNPAELKYGTVEEAMLIALNLEKDVNASILDMHALGSKEDDPNFCDFLDSEFLMHQVESIKELGDFITRLQLCGEGLGVFIFDNDLANHIKKK